MQSLLSLCAAERYSVQRCLLNHGLSSALVLLHRLSPRRCLLRHHSVGFKRRRSRSGHRLESPRLCIHDPNADTCVLFPLAVRAGDVRGVRYPERQASIAAVRYPDWVLGPKATSSYVWPYDLHRRIGSLLHSVPAHCYRTPLSRVSVPLRRMAAWLHRQSLGDCRGRSDISSHLAAPSSPPRERHHSACVLAVSRSVRCRQCLWVNYRPLLGLNTPGWIMARAAIYRNAAVYL